MFKKQIEEFNKGSCSLDDTPINIKESDKKHFNIKQFKKETRNLYCVDTYVYHYFDGGFNWIDVEGLDQGWIWDREEFQNKNTHHKLSKTIEDFVFSNINLNRIEYYYTKKGINYIHIFVEESKITIMIFNKKLPRKRL